MKRRIYDYVPPYYHEIRESDAILDRIAGETERLNDEISDVLDQFYVETATWGLSSWERIFGVATDETKSYEERRSVIKSRMRGSGTTTITLIKEVAESWYGGEVEVAEQFSDYKIVVKFVSSYGVPSNLDDVEQALREIIPAHLAIDFEFIYVTYNDLINKYGTYDGIVASGITYDDLIVT